MDEEQQSEAQVKDQDQPDEKNAAKKDEGGNKIITYSPKELSELRTSPHSSSWPKFLDEAFKNSRGRWDPDLFHQSRKPKDAEGPAATANPSSKKTLLKDPGKERVKAAGSDTGEGLVLGPRRGSFNTGCQVSQPPRPTAADGKESVPNSERLKEIKEMKERVAANSASTGVAGGNRRVGSGRILNNDNRRYGSERDGDFGSGFHRRDDDRFDRFGSGDGPRIDRDRTGSWFKDRYKDSNVDDDFNRRGNRLRDNERGGSRYNRDYDRRDDQHGNRHQKMNEEPEWMSEDVNQDELMELRGFDDSPKPEEDYNGMKAKGEGGPIKEEQSSKKEKSENNVLDNVLQLDSVPGLAGILDDGAEPVSSLPVLSSKSEGTAGWGNMNESGPAGGSRFSQFFQRQKSPEVQRERLEDDGIRIPSPVNSSAYFAPISPAAQTRVQGRDQQVPKEQEIMNDGDSIMNMLRGGGGTQDVVGRPEIMNQLKQVGAPSVEELEARINNSGTRQGKDAEPQHQQPAQEEEMSAFKKFAALVLKDEESPNQMQSDEGPIREPNVGLLRPAPMNMQDMMRHDFQNRQPGFEGQTRPGLHQRPAGPMLPHQMAPQGPPNEAQIQMEILGFIRQAQFNPDVMRRPEAMTLRACLEQGKVSPHLLLHQFIYGQLAPYHREILLNVLKIAQNNGLLGPPAPAAPMAQPRANSPRTSPSDPIMMLLQQQQQQRRTQLSPPQAGPPGQQRVPSPQELVLHTQQIMQNALIKRKLEEQRESYRKRMEQGKGTGDEKQDGALPGSSLAFTPTVVMKKLAADRRDSDPKIQVGQDLKNNFQPSQCGERIGPHGDAPEMLGGRITPSRLFEQSRGLPPSQIPPHLMQQQIRAQQMLSAQQMAIFQQQQQIHQQRANRHPSGGPMPVPGPPMSLPRGQPHQMPYLTGGPNSRGPSPNQGPQSQLSRFFSPGVLAQAQNSMPTLPVPSQAMTLEEIERKAAAAASVRM